MLVVADKQTFRVGRKGGLTCTRQTEEDSGIFALHIGVSRAVHRSNTLQRQVVVLHREHTFFHLTAVPGIDNYLLVAGGIESNAGLAVQTEFFVVLHFSLRSVVNHEVRLKVLQLLSSRTDKHIGNEVCLPCYLYDEADSQTGLFVGTAECIYNEQTFVAQLFLCQSLYFAPNFLRHRVVVVLVSVACPPNVVVALCVVNDVFVLRRTTGEHTRHYVYSTEFGQLTFLIAYKVFPHFLLEQLLVGRVVYDFGSTRDTVLCKI